MIKLSPYLRFNGSCREAMTFYKDCLGGELNLQSVEGSGAEKNMPPEAKHLIMHSTLVKDGFTLMGSDMGEPEGFNNGNTIAITMDFTTEEEIKTCFAKLSSGAAILDALHAEFWGGTFGRLRDKYGVEWLFNYEKKVEAVGQAPLSHM